MLARCQFAESLSRMFHIRQHKIKHETWEENFSILQFFWYCESWGFKLLLRVKRYIFRFADFFFCLDEKWENFLLSKRKLKTNVGCNLYHETRVSENKEHFTIFRFIGGSLWGLTSDSNSEPSFANNVFEYLLKLVSFKWASVCFSFVVFIITNFSNVTRVRRVVWFILYGGLYFCWL